MYDVEGYINLHPGGADNIEDHLGASIDEPFHNQEHSKAAYNTFKTFKAVGYIDSSNSSEIIEEKQIKNSKE